MIASTKRSLSHEERVFVHAWRVWKQSKLNLGKLNKLGLKSEAMTLLNHASSNLRKAYADVCATR